jgi:glutamate-1-semialdehyde 2,1-aminomutase
MPTIVEEFERKHPTSARLYDRARRVFPGGVTHDNRRFVPFPLYVDRAAGSRKWDVDGNEVIDYVMGHGALILGHCHPKLVEAVQRQVARGTHYGASSEAEVEWGEWVTRLVPSAERVRFTSSGTEATHMAVRLARAYTGKDKVVKFADHFHGWHDNLVGLPTNEGLMWPGVPQATLSNLIVLPANDVEAVERTLAHDKDIACVILEPTGAHMGSVPLDLPTFLLELRDITRRADVVLIFDEVVTGFRVSPGGVQAKYGVIPDLTTMAKILAGGLPGAAVAGRADLLTQIEHREHDPRWNAEQRIPHQGTFNANPLSAAAGIACLREIADGEATRRADAGARRLAQGMNRCLRAAGVPGAVYAVSSIVHICVGVECPPPLDGYLWNWNGAPGPDVPHMSDALTMTLGQAMLNHGVHLMGTRAIVSAVHSDEDIDATVSAFEAALRDMKADRLI